MHATQILSMPLSFFWPVHPVFIKKDLLQPGVEPPALQKYGFLIPFLLYLLLQARYSNSE